MAYLGLFLAVLLDNAILLLAPDRFGLQTAPPDISLITALYIGFHAKNTSQLRMAVVLGLIADCFSAHALGHFAFLFGAAAYIAHRVRRYLPPDAGISYIVACLFCGLATALLAFGIAMVTTRGAVAPGLQRGVLEALTSACFAPVVFGLWDKSRLFRKAIGGRRYDFA